MDHVYKDDGLLCWWRRWRPGVGSPGHEFVEQLWSNIKKQCQCLITPDWFLPEQYQYILWTALFIFLRILVLSAFKSSVPPVTNLTDFIKLNQWVSEMTCRIGFTWFDMFFTGVLCFLQRVGSAKHSCERLHNFQCYSTDAHESFVLIW